MVITKSVTTPTRVLGLDMSTQSFAFSRYDNKVLTRWGSVRYTGKSTFDRLADGQDKLLALKAQFADIERIVFEGSVYVQNKSTVILLAYAYGMAISAILPRGADIEQVAPVTWQNAIGNKVLTPAEKSLIKVNNPDLKEAQYKELYRRMRKQRTMDWANNKFGIHITDDNVSDAIGVGAWGADAI